MNPIGSFDPTYNSENWAGHIDVIDNDTGTAWDLSDILIELELRDDRGCRRFLGSTTDGQLEIEGDGFAFDFPPATMKQLCAGSYTAFIRLTDNTTGYVEVWSATLPVLDGGYR
jgi:hypothetical protein